MKVTAVVEREGGVYQFTAELTEQQHQFLIEYAIRDLVAKWLVPFNVDDSGEARVEIAEQAH